MKVTDWRRSLMASFVAAGIMAPMSVHAADLNTNLVVDGSFENVDTGDTGPFASTRLNDWNDTNLDGNATDDDFAYRHDQNYAGVNTPSGAGERYFTGGFNTTAGQTTITQSVSLLGGDTGTLIPLGEAAFNLSGFFSSYLGQADASRVRLRFLDASAVEIGSAEIGGTDFVQSLPQQPGTYGQHRDWGQDTGAGLIPVATQSVAIDVVPDVSAGNHDGYVDLVDFRVTSAADLLMFLEVDTTSGQATIKNQTGEAVNIDYYEIVSPGDSLNATSWNSLQEQNRAGFPAGNGSGNGWEQAGGSDEGVVGESYLLGSSSVADSSSIELGAAYDAGVGAQDLIFRYGALSSEAVETVGDYNGNGVVDAADYTVWRDTLGQTGGEPGAGADGSGNGIIDAADYDVWKNNFGNTGGPSGPSTLVTGFVRYVSAGASASTAVPEPSSIVLVGLGFLGCSVGFRRGARDDN